MKFSRTKSSGNDLHNGISAFNSDELLVQAGVVEVEFVGIKSKLMENGGVEVLHFERFLDCCGTELIGLADAHAAFDSASRHPHREAG